MKKPVINKKALTLKGILAIVLAAMMFILIAGFFATKNLKPERNKILVSDGDVTGDTAQNQETTTAAVEPVSDIVVEPVTDEGVSEGETDTTQPESTTAKPKALIAGITDEANWPLAIIGTEYPLPKDYTPQLANALPSNDRVQLDYRICQQYQQMYDAAKQAGCILTPYAGYHSFSSQEKEYSRKLGYYLNNGYTQQEAEALAARKVMPAGCSEHNAGIAIDVGQASADFANTKEYQWLCDHAQDYGFILRYPQEKESITGVDFQPWHWRFVGVENAQKMKDNNQCLEEYLGIV